MTITAKFSSRCPNCQTAINVGDKVEWNRGERAYHTVCPTMDLTLSMVVDVTPTLGPVVDQSGIIKFLNAAKAHLKAPKVRFLAPDGKGELRISMAPDSGKNAGALYVKVNDFYMGMIRQSGEVVRLSPELVACIERIAINPVAAAKAYGALMGRCSFCGIELTDAGSVEVGYGPICAKHYGLPHTPKGTPAVQTVGEVRAKRVFANKFATVVA